VTFENRGGVIREYVPDCQGSTIALKDTSGRVQDSWTYWPYGELRSHTGSSTTPFTWLGTLGYFVDTVSKWVYVRARELRVDLGRWLTADPLWPNERAYTYASAAVPLRVDSTGYGRFSVWDAIVACGAGMAFSLLQVLYTLLHGGHVDWKALFCGVGLDCLLAAIGVALFAGLTGETVGLGVLLAGCIAGAVVGLIASLIQQLYCEPGNPPLCILINAIVAAGIGCGLGMLFQGFDTFIQGVITSIIADAVNCTAEALLGWCSHHEYSGPPCATGISAGPGQMPGLPCSG